MSRLEVPLPKDVILEQVHVTLIGRDGEGKPWVAVQIQTGPFKNYLSIEEGDDFNGRQYTFQFQADRK